MEMALLKTIKTSLLHNRSSNSIRIGIWAVLKFYLTTTWNSYITARLSSR